MGEGVRVLFWVWARIDEGLSLSLFQSYVVGGEYVLEDLGLISREMVSQ